MCMKMCDAEKNFFLQTYKVFDLVIFQWLHLVSDAW